MPKAYLEPGEVSGLEDAASPVVNTPMVDMLCLSLHGTVAPQAPQLPSTLTRHNLL